VRRGRVSSSGLKWEDVDLENGVVKVRRTLTGHKGRLLFGEPKTKRSRRTVRLTEAAVKALKERLTRQMEHLGDLYEDQGLVFATERGTLINPTNRRNRSFAPLLRKASLPAIRFHDLRHRCATLLLSRNVNPKIVSEMLGRATVAMTLDTYSHTSLICRRVRFSGTGGDAAVAGCSKRPRTISGASYCSSHCSCKSPLFLGGRCWDRTSDLCRVKAVR